MWSDFRPGLRPEGFVAGRTCPRRADAPREAVFSYMTRWWGREQRNLSQHVLYVSRCLRVPELRVLSMRSSSVTVFSDCARQQLLLVKC